MTLLSNRKAIPPFAALRAFEAVGRLGGVRRAALELFVDHAVVSRHLRFLEDWLGVALFDRAGASLRLTRDGEAYHHQISTAINDIARATRDMTQTTAAIPICSRGDRALRPASA